MLGHARRPQPAADLILKLSDGSRPVRSRHNRCRQGLTHSPRARRSRQRLPPPVFAQNLFHFA